jgi:hypothetical protein
VNTDDLTFEGAQYGNDPVTHLPRATDQSVVANDGGGFTLGSSVDDIVISGFTIEDAGTSGNQEDGINAFAGSSGLTVEDNVIQDNNEGMNFQNPDGSDPAVIEDNVFANNDQGGNYLTNAGTGTAIFISNGPADNTTISHNTFTGDSQTAINFAGASGNNSTGLNVTENTSTNDATFVVATNSTNALIDGNTITSSPSSPGGFGDAILDAGANIGLRISDNVISATDPSSANAQAGVRLSTYFGSASDSTTITLNKITGYYYGVIVMSGYTSAYVSSNKIKKSASVGIEVQSGASGNVINRNKVKKTPSPALDCQDASTGSGTAGTANTWTSNVGEDNNSSPSGIC